MNRDRLIVIGMALLVLVARVNAASEHVPSAPRPAVDVATHLRVFWRADRWNPMIGLDTRSEHGFEQLYRSLTAGSYYRADRNLKLGAFYRLQQAARHDDDWIARDASFEWDDTENRTEHVFIADVSPRFLLPSLPGEDWVFMLKGRYAYNTHNAHQWVTVRPALTYFRIVDRRPRLNASLQWEFYLPVNFGETLLYAHWPYVNLLYHLTPTVKLDASVARKTRIWSTSRDVAEDPAHDDSERGQHTCFERDIGYLGCHRNARADRKQFHYLGDQRLQVLREGNLADATHTMEAIVLILFFTRCRTSFRRVSFSILVSGFPDCLIGITQPECIGKGMADLNKPAVTILEINMKRNVRHDGAYKMLFAFQHPFR